MLEKLKALLSPPPGCWIFPKTDSPKPDETGRFLNMLEERERAKTVLEKYTSGFNNALSLLQEAELLYKNQHYARAVALGISAWEELGKSQMAADFYTGVIPEHIYNKAFTDHSTKTSYFHRCATPKTTGKMGVIYDKELGGELERIRQDALYVSDEGSPERFSEEDAAFIIERVNEHLYLIHNAEEMNGLIGSKGIFK